jgi:dTDP-4-amino-4,6-dideoxygalactose transaminase
MRSASRKRDSSARGIETLLDHVGPLPRLRLYTTLRQYGDVLARVASGRVTSGDEVGALERKLRKHLGVQYAIAMPMARVGVYVTLRNLIKPGQHVILSPYTIADVVNMVICAGGVPIFADIERKTGNIDATEIERLIDENTGAVLVTHLYGLMCDVEHISAICKARNVPVVEDAAQSFGAKRDGRSAGTIGTAGIYSFGMYKNINSFYGGMVVTNDTTLASRVAADMATLPYQPVGPYLRKVVSAAISDVITLPVVFRNFTFWLFRYAFLKELDVINNRLKIDLSPKIKTMIPAEYLCCMTPLQAQLILGQLERVEPDMAARIRAAHLYHEGLKDIDELILPPLVADSSHMYWYYPIQYHDRHQLVDFAMRHYRDITESYHRNCAALPCFAAYARSCPNAEATANSLIYLPTYPRYSVREIEKTIATIRRFFGKLM